MLITKESTLTKEVKKIMHIRGPKERLHLLSKKMSNRNYKRHALRGNYLLLKTKKLSWGQTFPISVNRNMSTAMLVFTRERIVS